MAVLLVDEEVEQLAGARSRGAPLVRRRQEDFPRVVREGVETVRGARRRRVRQVRRGLDDFRRVVGGDGHDVAGAAPPGGRPRPLGGQEELGPAPAPPLPLPPPPPPPPPPASRVGRPAVP